MSKDKSTFKKVQTKDLKNGMFVYDVGRSWLKHPWRTKSKTIESDQDVDLLLEFGITEVIIDLAKSVTPKDVGDQVDPVEKKAPPAIQQVERRVRPRPEKHPDSTPLEEEIPKARQAHTQALEITREFINDARTGKKIDVEKVQESVDGMIDSVFRNRDALLTILKLKTYDEYTFTHSLNVGVLAMSVGRALNLSRDELRALCLGGIFHDVGKTGVPSEILNKPGRLTEEEFEVMKGHPVIGFNMLEHDKNISSISLDVIRSHHERIDGSGYPDGLAESGMGPHIFISGIADVYDALSTDRVYHKGRPPHEALKIVFSLKGKHFPPQMVDAFIHCLGIYPPGTTVRLNTGETAVVHSVNHSSMLRPKTIIVFDNKGQAVTKTKILDLNEKGFVDRQIVKVVDPQALGIDPAKYFEG